MPITSEQKTAVEEVIQTILDATSSGGKRQRAAMFLELVDRTDWPQYYEVIPEPRCLNNIKASVEKGRYKDATQVYTDLSLVFWNALYYNEANSQIARDAQALKTVLETEWKKRPSLPAPRSSPPPSSAQKVHKADEAIAAETPVDAMAQVQPKPGPSKPTIHRQSTPEVEVDIMSPDSDGGDEDQPMPVDRDPLSEEIVRNLERGLPRWTGFGELGWMEYATPDRLIDLVHSIKSHKDIVGNRFAVALEEVPEDPVIPNLSYAGPISLKSIDARAHARQYASAKEFDLDMSRMFEKARRWQEPSSDAYGRVLLLQRLYQALTSPNPPVGPPFLSGSNFAALRAGPGIVKPVHGADSEGVPSVTTHRVLTKDRTFIDELHYKGWTLKLSEWVHLANPDDPSRPIIGQIFRCWVSEEPKGQLGVTVSWYYRPEQTYHPPSRQFWQQEVFKTSHFADHPIEDLIEKIACQFTARHVRGRPRPPFWFVGWPLYVCDARYNDRERIFVKIKNWNSCVPEEVRKSSEFMPIYPFERMVYPVRLPSPLVISKSANKFPGGLLPESGEPTEDASGPASSKRGSTQRREASGGVSSQLIQQQQQQQQQHVQTNPQHSYYQNALYNLPPQQQLSYQPQPILPQQAMQRAPGPDRSVIAAAGGLAAIGGAAQVDKLPAETAKHFDRDPETNQVLWFAAPPVDAARYHPPKPSLEYLNFLAKKRKREEQGGDGEPERDIPCAPPTVTETMRAMAKEIFSKS